MSDIRIDLAGIEERTDAGAITADDMKALIGEVQRLSAVNDRWAGAWKKIIAANAEGFEDRINYLQERVNMLERLL